MIVFNIRATPILICATAWHRPAFDVVVTAHNALFLLANGPEALAETKALALESSFSGMSVDDEAYARLVRMHSAKRQTSEASEGLASFAEKRAAKWQTG
jgi:enoyl-CoA hydratase/carnithine racemase